MCFELWQDTLLNGTAPDPKRYEAEVLDFYKDILAGRHAPFYFMFMGFLGGLDFADMTEKAQRNKSNYGRGRLILALADKERRHKCYLLTHQKNGHSLPS